MIGDGDDLLECGDCHSQPGAHNWTGPNVLGLDPDWMPENNGRPASGIDTRDAENAISNRVSDTCELCHYYLRDSSAFTVRTPTALQADAYRDMMGQFPEDGGRSNLEFQRLGEATHFLGDVDMLDVNGAVRGWDQGVVFDGTTEIPFDARNQDWPNGNTFNDTNTAWSRWGTPTPGEHLVCESCHELEPDKNALGSKLLVYWYEENADSGRGGDNSATSYFCEGCHGDNGPTGTHPLTGDTVDRTGNVLTTDPGVSELLATTAPSGLPHASFITGSAGTSTFPNSGNTTDMSCDSCHQVHDAPDQSGTYILEGPDANLNDNGQPLGEHGGGVAGSHPGTPPELDYTGFCDQCHWYTYDIRP